jgi:hypothetical protein
VKKTCLAAVFMLTLLPACSSVSTTVSLGQACRIGMATSPGPGGEGVVVELLSQASAMALLVRTQAQVGAPIDGAYIGNVRAILRRPDGRNATVLIPYDMTVAVGDRIAFQGSYRSPGLPCSYVPNLATRKL